MEFLIHIFYEAWRRVDIANRFAIKKKIIGVENKIIYNNVVFKNVKFDISGNNNTIIIENWCNLRNVVFYIRGNNNTIVLHEYVMFYGGGMLWETCDNGHIEIGIYASAEKNVNIQIAEDGLKVIIGRACMFASDIVVWPQDWHKILDKTTGNIINSGKDITIKEHVWIGSSCKILKGVVIGKDSVVGAGTIVTKQFDESNVLIAGNPGKIIKRGVNWAH
jgi:acetyltransferase-like isoleucine patch superfamily enzyme